MDGVLFKIDLKMSYDKVNCYFLQQALSMMGFAPILCEWIASFVQSGSVGIRPTDDIGHYFQTFERLEVRGSVVPHGFQYCGCHVGNPHCSCQRGWSSRWPHST